MHPPRLLLFYNPAVQGIIKSITLARRANLTAVLLYILMSTVFFLNIIVPVSLQFWLPFHKGKNTVSQGWSPYHRVISFEY